MSGDVARLPPDVGGVAVPQDDVAAAAWRWAQRSLPEYLLGHSVRSFAWGAAMARRERWSFDAQVLWTAAMFHDVGLTHIGRNTMCFEIEGAEIARRFLVRQGMAFDVADRAAIAIILHMRPNVTLADGVEAVLLERATGLDVRGVGFELVAGVRRAVTDAFPRGAFDRRFQAAIRREVEVRTDCQSARLFGDGTLGERMAHSPWAAEEGG